MKTHTKTVQNRIFMEIKTIDISNISINKLSSIKNKILREDSLLIRIPLANRSVNMIYPDSWIIAIKIKKQFINLIHRNI